MIQTCVLLTLQVMCANVKTGFKGSTTFDAAVRVHAIVEKILLSLFVSKKSQPKGVKMLTMVLFSIFLLQGSVHYKIPLFES